MEYISTTSKTIKIISSIFPFIKKGIEAYKKNINDDKLIDIINSIEFTKNLRPQFKELEKHLDVNNIDSKLAISLFTALQYKYTNNPEFNFFYFIGEKENWISFDENYTILSFIPDFEARKRETINKNEKIHRLPKSTNQNFIQYDYLAEEVIETFSKIFVTGMPGIGKTIFAKRFCNIWANKEQITRRIPIYIQLRDLDFSKENILSEYILKKYLNDMDENNQKVQKLIKDLSPIFTFLLDGFDELGYQKQDKLRDEISDIYNNKINYVLFTRPYGLLNAQRWESSYSISIDGFAENNIRNFIKNYLNLKSKNNATGNQASVEKLINIISHNVILQDVAHIPLFLSYITQIYVENKEQELINIASKYELLSLVFKTLVKQHEQKGFSCSLSKSSKKIEEISYELLIKNKYQYKLNDETIKLLEPYLNMGIITYNTDSFHNTFLSFNNITFLEFFATRFIVEKINIETLQYLSNYHNFWHFIQLIIGCLDMDSNEKDKELVNNLFVFLSKQSKSYYYYLYTLLLSECKVNYLNTLFKHETIVEGENIKYIKPLDYYLLSLSEDSEYSSFPSYRLLPYALNSIFGKLNVINRDNFIKRIIFEARQTEFRNPYILDKYNFSEIYYNLIKKINLKNNEKLLNGLLVEFIKLDNVNSDFESFLYQFLEVLALFEPNLFTSREIKENLNKILANNKIKDYFFNIYIKINYQNFSTTETFNELKCIFNELLLKECKVPRCNNNVLQQIGQKLFVLSKSSEYKEKTVKLIIDNSEKIYFLTGYSTFSDDPTDIEEDTYDEFLIENIIELIITSLNNFNDERLYSLIVDLVYINNPVSLGFEIIDDAKFIKFLKNKYFDDFKWLNDENSLEGYDFSVFEIALALINSNKNIRYHFFDFRDSIINNLDIFVMQHNEIFKKYSSYTITNEPDFDNDAFRKVKLIDNFLSMFYETNNIYSFDKKSLIDTILDREYSQYKYFKHHFLPRLLENDIELYQETHINFLNQYLNPEEFKYLVSIIRNASFYNYSSNLSFANKVLEFIILNIDKAFIEEHYLKYLEIISRTLFLLKREDMKEKPTKLSMNLLKNIEKIVLHKKVVSICNSEDISAVYEEAFLCYPFMFYFTENHEFNIQVDFYSKLDYRGRKRYFLELIKFFNNNKGLDLDSVYALKPIIKENLYKTILKKYLDYNSHVQEVFDYNFLNKLVKNKLKRNPIKKR